MLISCMNVLHMGSNMPCNGVPRNSRWSETFNTSRIVYGHGQGAKESGWNRARANKWAELRIKRLHNWGIYDTQLIAQMIT